MMKDMKKVSISKKINQGVGGYSDILRDIITVGKLESLARIADGA